MIDTLAKILLDCPMVLAARDIIMSDMVEMFKSDKILPSFLKFFQNDGQDDYADTSNLGLESNVKFQVCDQSVDFLTTASVEQLSTNHDAQKRNPNISQL